MRKVRGNTTPRLSTKLHKVSDPSVGVERGPQSVASGLHISRVSSQCAAGAGAGRRPCPCAPASRGCWWTDTGAASQVPVQHTVSLYIMLPCSVVVCNVLILYETFLLVSYVNWYLDFLVRWHLISRSSLIH